MCIFDFYVVLCSLTCIVNLFLGVDDEETKTDSIDIDPSVVVNCIELPKISGQDLKLKMIAFMEQLPHLINRDLIDNAALDFVTNLNTRNNRRKLCQSKILKNLDFFI